MKSFRLVVIAFLVLVCVHSREASAACSQPNGVEGNVIYNDDFDVVQFCDGTNWVSMAGGDAEPGGTDTQVQFNDSGELGGAQMFWDKAASRLGVGVTNPTETIDVGSGGIAANQIVLKRASGANAPINSSFMFTAGTGSEVQFRDAVTGQLAADSSLTWDNTNKRLGIRTSSPDAPLHIVAASSGGTILQLENTDTGGGIWRLYSTGSGNSMGANRFLIYGGGSPRVTVDPTGNVGIGTTQPANQLEVVKSGNTAILLKDSSSNRSVTIGSNTGGDYPYIGFTNNGYSWQLYPNHNSTPNYFGWWLTSASADKMRLYTTGALWIGGALTQNSDERLKRDIKPIPNALKKIQRLTGVSFSWRDASRQQGTQLGVIAQDVEKVFPEVVSTDENGIKNVSYTALVSPLIEAVKELKVDNDNLYARLKAANDNQAAEIRDLRKEIEALKTAR